MKFTTNSILFIFAVLALMMLACIPIALVSIPFVTARQTQPVNSLATIQARFTPTALLPTVPPPTTTPLPPTVIVVPPTNTPFPATYTPVSYCDQAMFVKDVTVPDGSTFAPGETFTKTWRVKNRGTCAWSPDYLLVFNSGEQMGGTIALRLPAYIAPGQSADISVSLTAPSAPGHYIGYWMLRNPAGVLFGSGSSADEPFYVDIFTKERRLQHGTVTGSICYPSDFPPAMTLYFENAASDDVIQFYVPENSIDFSFLLPNGTYYARAVASGFDLEGAYINPDRTMKTFVINGGQTTSGIRICDWDVSPHSRGQ
jgi:hypothetical protein